MTLRWTKEQTEKVRQRLINDPDTQGIAKSLGVKLSDYVEQVIGFLKDPSKQPAPTLMTEEEAEKQGIPFDSEAEITQWLKDVVDGNVQLGGDSFEKVKAAPMSLSGEGNARKKDK